MTREQAKQQIMANFGIEDVTDEMISNYLNSINGAIKSEKDRADKLKADASLVDDLKAQLEELNSQNLSEVEKANKETAKANEQIALLTKQIKAMETKTKLAELGIIGEQAETLFTADGTMDFNVLGQIIAQRETQASSLKEQEILKNTPNPTSAKDKASELSDAETVAKSLGKNLSTDNKIASDVIAQYT